MTPASTYRPGREIARGGMGAVLDARDQKLGRSVAMKVMLRRNASEEEQQRFLQEARVLGQLAHPNIVPVHDVGTDEQGRLFYTMKLVQGGTLHDVIGKLKAGDEETLARYPLNALLTVFQKVCDAVAFAHSRGIIHRDLKPQNIMVGEFGEVLVMDWGLAKILPGSAAAEEAAKALPLRGQLGQTGPTGTLPLHPPVAADDATLASGTGADEGATLASGAGSAVAPKLSFGQQESESAPASGTYATLEGAVMGTPHYMSPEQAEGRISDLDARSDIFSLGGIFYALLTLRPPVEGESLEEILSKVRRGDITPPSAFNSGSGTQHPHHNSNGEVVEPKKIIRLLHLPDGRVPAALSAVVMKALAVDRERRYQTVAAVASEITAFQGGFATSAENATALTLLRLFLRRHKLVVGAAAAVILVLIGGIVASTRQANEARKARDAEKQQRTKADDERQKAESERDAKELARKDAEEVANFLGEIFRSPDPNRSGHSLTVAEILDTAAKRLNTGLAAQPAQRAKLQATLAGTYHGLGLYQEVVPLREKVRDYHLATSGPDHPDTLRAMLELAISYEYAGRRWDEALKMKEQVLALRRKLSGPEHPDTLKAIGSLAVSYNRAGRHAEALKMKEEVLALYRKLRGQEHADTLMAMSQLSDSYSDVGHLAEALTLREELLTLCRKVNGPERLATISAMQNLADSYSVAGRRDEAFKLREEVLALHRKVNGPEHISTLAAMGKLASSYRAKGEVARAEGLEKEIAIAKAKTKPASKKP